MPDRRSPFSSSARGGGGGATASPRSGAPPPPSRPSAGAGWGAGVAPPIHRPPPSGPPLAGCPIHTGGFVQLTTGGEPIQDVCFLRLEDLQAATDERISARARQLICPVTGRSILNSWQAEQEHLLMLPQTLPEPFDVQVHRQVTDDCLVSFEGRQYQVPCVAMRRTVQVRGCAGTVEIYGADGQHLASYPRGTACRLLLDQRHAEGEGDNCVMRPTPLGALGQRIVLERSWEVPKRPMARSGRQGGRS